ncbi:uncharacterized protein Pyn_41184 [Prunus yedoensis var. nudiflora]|uniref:Uncharacterized protein n=1 Tax=Prunus yedoensis var. nudiflora TaxID=2094558 RepID=A0A314XL01_PRUYE|nr:uncharacterized protein Pyn_41184 [Prunus yedoensis var. nudiflora]
MENVSNLYANTESQAHLAALGEWFVRLGADTEFEGNIGGFTSNANGINIPCNEDNSNRQGHGIDGETNFTTASFEVNGNMMNDNRTEAMPNLETHEVAAEPCVSCGSTSTNRVRKKKRGINRLNWGMLAHDHSLFPLDTEDWRKLEESDHMDKAWDRAKCTLDWSNPEMLTMEKRIRDVVVEKLNDRFRSFRAMVKRVYYTPFIGMEERLHCGDDRVHPDQWRKLVNHWDEDPAKVEKHGVQSDQVTFFVMTHTRGKGDNKQPVDEASREMMLEFEKREAEVRERGEDINTEVRNQIFAAVMGPEKRNAVRGYGIGVHWKDVPNIITERRGISREVQELREAYEEQRQAAVEAQQKMERIMEEANEKADRLKCQQQENVNAMASAQFTSMTQQQCGSSQAQTTTQGYEARLGMQCATNAPQSDATHDATDCHSANSG